MKTITKAQLQQIIERQDDWKYNRQVEAGILQSVPENAEFELRSTMRHAHKGGEPCEEHLRCALLRADKVLAFIDMPQTFYDSI
jgi:hypothetical protein